MSWKLRRIDKAGDFVGHFFGAHIAPKELNKTMFGQHQIAERRVINEVIIIRRRMRLVIGLVGNAGVFDLFRRSGQTK